MPWQNNVVYHALSDVGIKRSHNQDAFGVLLASNAEAWDSRGHLFVVADGMGAHAVGELASKMAVDAIQIAYHKLRDLSPNDAIRQAIVEANQSIHERGQKNREFEGMGTTVTALALLANGAWIGHVGDSRCYRIRGPAIEQLSFDHSLQWEMARRQNVTPEKLKSVPRNVIIRSLGPEKRVKVDVNGPYHVEDGDQFLLCSDGLSTPVSDRELWAITSFLPGDEACKFLVDLANLRGGMDNITLVLVQFGKGMEDRKKPKRLRALLSREFWWRGVRRIPLYGWFLISGLVMAAAGYLLGKYGRPNVFIPLVAILSFVAALGGMVLRRKKKADAPPSRPAAPPPVYRSNVLWMDDSLVEGLARMVPSLRELAIEENWRLDWAELQKLKQTAEEHQTAGRHLDAFKSYCRLLSMLAIGMRAARDKQEVFRPHWQQEGN
ncbi:MAG: protein phosphatase 2C domain-containing protein [Planctomycetota bacterium]